MKEFPRLTTARLVLRAFNSADVDDLVRLAGDFAIADTTLVIPHPYDRAAAEKWLATHGPRFESGEEAILAATVSGTGELIGAIGLAIDARFDRAEIGYWIGKPYWGQGYCTEAAQALRDWGFTELGLNRVYSDPLQAQPCLGPGDAETGNDAGGRTPSARQEVGPLRGHGGLRHSQKRVGCPPGEIGLINKPRNWSLTPAVFSPKLDP